MISVAYTCVRVKQSIGWTNILPLSFYWRRSGPLQPQYQRISRDNRSDRIAVRLSLPNSNGFSYIGTPEGGIVLHWIVTVFYICVTASINSLDKAISFSANLLVYGHFFIEALVGLGFTWFKPIDLRPRPKGYPARRWFPDDDLPDRGRWMRDKDWNKFDQSPGIFKLAIKWLSSGLFQTVIGLLVAILSGVLIVLEAIPTGSPTAWGFVNLIVTMAIMLAAAVYWAFLVPAASSDGCSKTRFGFDLLLSTHGINDETDPERICYFCEIFHAIELLNLNLNQNHPREVQQQAQEGGHRHPHYGYLHYVSRRSVLRDPPQSIYEAD
ncbi:hypothetical protein GQ607_010278 [Colletotrichum asianum]|uniref:Uncharacterized protein n=1 Tax=Colletotrichum asianum TaxID=702518 RepID=A0A8H3WA92_9PEZI|nr:hypothetical protein GQ607_010278 [Colletotrichum asianum]